MTDKISQEEQDHNELNFDEMAALAEVEDEPASARPYGDDTVQEDFEEVFLVEGDETEELEDGEEEGEQ